MNDNMSPSDFRAVLDANNNSHPYPYPMYGNGGFGNAFGGDGSWIWFILILALFGGFGNNGNGFGNGFNNDYAWLSNGQKEIMQNTNNGFDTLQLTNQLTGISTGVQALATQLCNCCADMNQTVNAGFANAETAANARQMASMQQAFNSEIATLNGFNDLNTAIYNASADNRLGISNLTATVLAENCADRAALQEGVRDIITNATSNTQRILDQLCADKIDAKNEKISDLQREILMKDLQASQVAQTADLRANNAVVANQLVAELRSCPIPAQPVYGNQPIFTCSGGCGCNNVYGNTIV